MEHKFSREVVMEFYHTPIAFSYCCYVRIHFCRLCGSRRCIVEHISMHVEGIYWVKLYHVRKIDSIWCTRCQGNRVFSHVSKWHPVDAIELIIGTVILV